MTAAYEKTVLLFISQINWSEEPVGIRGSRRMSGTPVSQGKVVATARVLLTVEDAHEIQKGDVLITYATDIGWSPYFPMLGGIVTELGGLMSHGKYCPPVPSRSEAMNI